MNIDNLNNEILSIIHEMAFDKINESIIRTYGFPTQAELKRATNELKLSAKVDQLANVLVNEGVEKFWSVFNALLDKGLIQNDDHFSIGYETLEIRLSELFPLYEQFMLKWFPGEVRLNKDTLYKALQDHPSFIKKHKPFFGGRQKWALQFRINKITSFV